MVIGLVIVHPSNLTAMTCLITVVTGFSKIILMQAYLVKYL